MIDLDFLEIGTSDFDTLYQSCDDTAIGMSVEPLKCYLDNLTGKPNVIKICCAVSPDNIEDEVKIFYVPKDVIDNKQLPFWLLGCNRIGDYHPAHIDLNITHLVKTESIKQIPISKLLTDNNIRKINLLKIDTEGNDCFILNHFFHYLKTKDSSYYPNKIIFESNYLTDQNSINQTIELFVSLGYTLISSTDNTVLIY